VKDASSWIRCIQLYNYKTILYGCLNKSDISVFDVLANSYKRSLKGHSGVIYCLQLHEGNLLSGSGDGTVKFWDIEKAQCLKTIEAHPSSGVLCLQSDANYLVTGATDTTIRVWNSSSGTLLHTLSGHSGSVWSIQFDREMKIILSGSEDRSLRLWNLETGALVSSVEGKKWLFMYATKR